MADGITDWMHMSLGELRELVMDRDSGRGKGQEPLQAPSPWTQMLLGIQGGLEMPRAHSP